MVQKYNIILIWHLYLFTLNVGLFFSIYSDFGFYTVRPGRLERSAKAFLLWPAELLTAQKTLRYVSVRHHRSGVRKT